MGQQAVDPTQEIRTAAAVVDPRRLNEGLIHEVYHTPAFDEITPHLSKVKLFSNFGLANGFWHCVLEEDSSELTTFQTPFGRFRFKRLPFGLSVAPEIFYKRLVQILEGLEGVFALADDVLVCGSGDTAQEARADHDRNVREFLQRCQQKGIKLNRDKVTLRAKNTKFFGFILTDQGMQINPEKQKKIEAMQAPKDVVGLKSFLGMLSHIARAASREFPKRSGAGQPKSISGFLRPISTGGGGVRREQEWSGGSGNSAGKAGVFRQQNNDGNRDKMGAD